LQGKIQAAPVHYVLEWWAVPDRVVVAIEVIVLEVAVLLEVVALDHEVASFVMVVLDFEMALR
jgi:hypothetical protein